MWWRMAPVRRLGVDLARTVMPALEAAGGDLDVVGVEAGERAGACPHLRRRALGGDDAVVADLAAGLGVERRLVEDDLALLARVEATRAARP